MARIYSCRLISCPSEGGSRAERLGLPVGIWEASLEHLATAVPSTGVSASGETRHSTGRLGPTNKSQFQPMLAISSSVGIRVICRRAEIDRASDALRSPPLEENALPFSIVRLPKPRQIPSSPLGVSSVNSALRRYPQNTPKPSKRDESSGRRPLTCGSQNHANSVIKHLHLKRKLDTVRVPHL
jgi:hypothetical protein